MFEDNWRWMWITNKTIVRMLLRQEPIGLLITLILPLDGTVRRRQEGVRNSLNSVLIWVFVLRAPLSNDVLVLFAKSAYLLKLDQTASNSKCHALPPTILVFPFFFFFFCQIRCKISDWKSLCRHCSTSNSSVNRPRHTVSLRNTAVKNWTEPLYK